MNDSNFSNRHLPAAEVAKAVTHRGPSRVPMMLHFWTDASRFGERAAEAQAILDRYPSDACSVWPAMPTNCVDPASAAFIPGYTWTQAPASPPDQVKAHDANIAITDWSTLDDLLARLPDPNHPAALASLKDKLQTDSGGRYTMLAWWYCLYERIWSLRGMENVLMDFYLNPESVHRLLDALTDFYCALIRRAGRELGLNAIMTSDDIGMQTGPMFSRDIFLQFFKARYARIIKTAHDSNMHFWLHTCGNVKAFLDDFVEIGLDVIHPIQKYTMDERETANKYGGKLCFWAGMDVQQILPRGTPEDVRREVRFMIDTYDRPDGGCIITAGNAITPDVPLENLEALYDETYRYGLEHRQRFA